MVAASVRNGQLAIEPGGVNIGTEAKEDEVEADEYGVEDYVWPLRSTMLQGKVNEEQA